MTVRTLSGPRPKCSRWSFVIAFEIACAVCLSRPGSLGIRARSCDDCDDGRTRGRPRVDRHRTHRFDCGPLHRDGGSVFSARTRRLYVSRSGYATPSGAESPARARTNTSTEMSGSRLTWERKARTLRPVI